MAQMERSLYWAPIPILRLILISDYCVLLNINVYNSWILPIVGHVGISGSKGDVYDFAASYTIHVPNYYLIVFLFAYFWQGK
jgi:hypothetical protein